MPIPEEQFDTWAKQGAVTGSKNTYATIKRVLEDPNAPYASRSFEVFLQGSYGNDTNVFAESDVDVVICLTESFKYDVSKLSDVAKQNFDVDYADVAYGLSKFKKEVTEWLTRIYEDEADPGDKAVRIEGNGTRRDADVLPCCNYRRYSSFMSTTDQDYDLGIAFLRGGGRVIHNFPKQHSQNMTNKHKETDFYLKPMVRVLKNMRNRMVAEGEIGDGVAPSYFIEGMLWNVPTDRFGASYADTFVAAVNWLLKCDKTQLACANNLHWLIRENASVCWNEADFNKFLAALSNYWKEW